MHEEIRTADEPEAVYGYEDEHGAPLYEVVRFPGKRFLQRLPLGPNEHAEDHLPEVMSVEYGKNSIRGRGREGCSHALRALGKIAHLQPRRRGQVARRVHELPC